MSIVKTDLISLLSAKRPDILKKWLDEILHTYPSETAAFLKTDKDPFSNPPGHVIRSGIEGIFNNLLGGADDKEALQFLDNIIRVRAIQDFTASQALSFIFSLKKVIRGELKDEIDAYGLQAELSILEDRLDSLSLVSFDIFMKCRETLYELRAKEVKNMTFKLLQKAKLITEAPEQI